MEYKDKNNNKVKAIQLYLIIFVLFSFISYIFTIITGYYNGDFLLQKCTLSFPIFTLNFILTIVPFFILYYIYIFFKKKYKPKYFIPTSSNTIENFSIILNIIYLILVAKYNVGKAFAEVYSAPPLITLIIQIILRLSPTSWLTFSFFITNDKKKMVLFAFMLILNGILTGYFSIFLTLIFMLILKYNYFFIPFIKKNFLVLIFLLAVSAPIMELGYTIRDTIRGTESNVSSMDNTTLIIGKFFGRLSPLPNTSMILQNEKIYKTYAENLPTTFYLNSMIGGVIYSNLKLSYPPEKILSGSKEEDYVSFMCGTTGILYFAWDKSWFCFIITLLLIITMVILIFKILSTFKFNLKYEVGFFLLMYPTMTGVGKEFFSILWALFVIFFICIIKNALKKLLVKKTV